MKKAVIVVIAILSILVSGCSSENEVGKEHVFKGENENWAGVYRTELTASLHEKDDKIYCVQMENHVLVLTYKNNISELSDVRHVKISYKSGLGDGGSLSEDYDSPPTKKEFKLGAGSRNEYQMSGVLEEPENIQKSMLIFSGPNRDYVKDHTIKIMIHLDGKTEKLELVYHGTSGADTIDPDTIKNKLKYGFKRT